MLPKLLNNARTVNISSWNQYPQYLVSRGNCQTRDGAPSKAIIRECRLQLPHNCETITICHCGACTKCAGKEFNWIIYAAARRSAARREAGGGTNPRQTWQGRKTKLLPKPTNENRSRTVPKAAQGFGKPVPCLIILQQSNGANSILFNIISCRSEGSRGCRGVGGYRETRLQLRWPSFVCFARNRKG